MAVYIKGMKIPKSCYDCEFVYWSTKQRASACFLLPFMKCFESHSTEYREKRSEHCPLIEVPEPHGRMIDADALVEDLKRQCEEVFKIDAVSPDDFWITRDQAYNERLWKTWCESFFEYLKTRETIIPASGKEE